MRRLFCAGALALAIGGLLPQAVVTVAVASDEAALSPRLDIARIKNVLRLSAEQQVYWPPVEAALRGLARNQQRSDGIVHRIGNGVVSGMLDAAAIARLGAAARPLVRVLDERQKQDAIALCHEMGLGPVLASLY